MNVEEFLLAPRQEDNLWDFHNTSIMQRTQERLILQQLHNVVSQRAKGGAGADVSIEGSGILGFNLPFLCFFVLHLTLSFIYFQPARQTSKRPSPFLAALTSRQMSPCFLLFCSIFFILV